MFRQAGGDTGVDEPEHERGLVGVEFALAVRNEPVVPLTHLARDKGEARLVGRPQVAPHVFAAPEEKPEEEEDAKRDHAVEIKRLHIHQAVLRQMIHSTRPPM